MASPPLPQWIRHIVSSLKQCDPMHNMLGLHYKTQVWTMKWWLLTTRQAPRLSWVLCTGKPDSSLQGARQPSRTMPQQPQDNHRVMLSYFVLWQKASYTNHLIIYWKSNTHAYLAWIIGWVHVNKKASYSGCHRPECLCPFLGASTWHSFARQHKWWQ
jgi:hypothetical protein